MLQASIRGGFGTLRPLAIAAGMMVALVVAPAAVIAQDRGANEQQADETQAADIRASTDARAASPCACDDACHVADDARAADNARAEDPAWQDIFNGRDLDGWIAEGTTRRNSDDGMVPVWTVEENEIRCGGGGFGFLRFDRRVCDFALRGEVRLAKGANSGLGIRTVPYRGVRQTRPSFAAYEIQIQDDHGKPADSHSTGSLYRYVAPTENAIKPAGEWNTFEVECVGPRIVLRINGRVVQDIDQSQIAEIKDKPLCGYVCLQNHGTPVTFRNLQLRELGTPQPAE